MNLNPIKVGAHQPYCYLSLLQKLAKFILSAMLSTELISDNSICAFQLQGNGFYQ